MAPSTFGASALCFDVFIDHLEVAIEGNTKAIDYLIPFHILRRFLFAGLPKACGAMRKAPQVVHVHSPGK